jgi:hypothetical protein
MADSGSLRVKRHRLHRAGNHSLCRPGCGGITQVPAVAAKIREVSGDRPGSREDSAAFDPRLAMGELAVQLRAACEANPADAVLAREYRLTLMELAKGGDSDAVDPFAELLAGLSAPVGDPAR